MNETEGHDPGQPAEHNEAPPPVADANPLAEAFYERAIWRMQRGIVAIGIVVIAVAAVGFGAVAAVGAALGAVLSWHNFRWLSQAVNALGERITTGQKPRARRPDRPALYRAHPFDGRRGLCYIQVFRGGLYGYVAGLCVPVPALFFEAAYELDAAYRRGL